jgi:hypothetical protein
MTWGNVDMSERKSPKFQFGVKGLIATVTFLSVLAAMFRGLYVVAGADVTMDFVTCIVLLMGATLGGALLGCWRGQGSRQGFHQGAIEGLLIGISLLILLLCMAFPGTR